MNDETQIGRLPPEHATPCPPFNRDQRWAHTDSIRASGVVALVFIAAALLTWRGVHSMSGGMAMPGGWTMSMMWMVMPDEAPWSAAWKFLLMWQAMMIVMMLPSTWPMLSLYRRTAKHTAARRASLATFLTGAGYFAVWLVFGAVAFVMGLALSRLAMQSNRMSQSIPAAAGVALILAGIYQLTPLKQACLRHCRDPILFLGHAWRPGFFGALRIGIHHGVYCAACCWALMVIQIVLGVMNLGVMTAVAAVIAGEKLLKRGPILARATGAAAIAIGAVLLARSL
jgi:predicted metal-binding membrane protein